ncbi:MAG TPA: M23 family metallopeptidase [Acidimicrobiales bacterium]|nr:M23 family metallopeptidase [Acidimicrobiales bacterium]
MNEQLDEGEQPDQLERVLAAAHGHLAAGPASGYGQRVRLDHGAGITTTYAHVSAYLVQVGQAVEAGQLIALVGNEGHSTGPHLHFQVEVGGSLVDPVAFYAAHGGSLGG